MAMSAFVPVESALPLKADVAAVGRESPLLTRSGPPLHRGTSQKDFVEAKEAAPVA
jgi:hypothetical protein